MSSQDRNLEQAILEKMRSLPPEKIGQVEDFIDFLIQRGEHRLLTRAASALCESSFQKVWDNPEDAEYSAHLARSTVEISLRPNFKLHGRNLRVICRQEE